MRVLVACEYSGAVRDAFLTRGHDAMSCDLYPTETPGPHYLGDVRDILGDGWDLMVAHPPCQYMAVSGARWLYDPDTHTLDPDRWKGLWEAAHFFRELWEAPIPRVAVENPRMLRAARVIIGRGRRIHPTQVIHPWEHGHGETKSTGLWLRNLPELVPTNVVTGRRQMILEYSPGPDRWMDRSRTYPGIAAAMADQWGDPRQGALFDVPTPGVPSDTTHPAQTPIYKVYKPPITPMSRPMSRVTHPVTTTVTHA